MKECPKCGYLDQNEEPRNETSSCQKCGLIFSKYRPPAPPINPSSSPQNNLKQKPIKLTKQGSHDPINPKIFIISGIVILVLSGIVAVQYFDHRTMIKSGFSSAAEFKRAKEQGFSTKKDFDIFLYEKHQREAAEYRSKEAARKEEKRREFEACRKDLECLAESKSIFAAVYCKEQVERLAKYSFEWTDGWTESKFTHYRWRDQGAGIVTYLGDRIKFQMGACK